MMSLCQDHAWQSHRSATHACPRCHMAHRAMMPHRCGPKAAGIKEQQNIKNRRQNDQQRGKHQGAWVSQNLEFAMYLLQNIVMMPYHKSDIACFLCFVLEALQRSQIMKSLLCKTLQRQAERQRSREHWTRKQEVPAFYWRGQGRVKHFWAGCLQHRLAALWLPFHSQVVVSRSQSPHSRHLASMYLSVKSLSGGEGRGGMCPGHLLECSSSRCQAPAFRVPRIKLRRTKGDASGAACCPWQSRRHVKALCSGCC